LRTPRSPVVARLREPVLPAELLDGQAGLGLPALKELTTENARLKKLLAEGDAGRPSVNWGV